MEKREIRFIAEMGIFIALGLVLDFLSSLYSSAIWPMGGSISIAMLPIFIMSFRYGIRGGLISGFAIGSVQILWAGSGFYHWVQVLLDYTLGYTVVGIAGVFAKKIFSEEKLTSKLYYVNNAIIIGGALRTVVHIISGYVFFSEFAPEGLKHIPFSYSVIYNLGYMVPSIIVCLIIMRIIVGKYNNLVEYAS